MKKTDITKPEIVILLTGVSGSGKTTLQNELLSRGWKRPLNFTTRTPRTEEGLEDYYNTSSGDDYNSEEYSEYIFVTKNIFLKKIKNGDFLEFTEYNGQFYGVSKFISDRKVCAIVEPAGREQILKYCILNGIKVRTIFLYINKETQYKRLIARGDTDEEIKKRQLDFKYFYPTENCLKLNCCDIPVEKLVDILEIWLEKVR